jgi:diketogulonate reductase-like aldo/keto reductase
VSSRRPRGRRSRRSTALDVGYGHIDTAAAYGNEREVGEAIRRFGLDRSDVFVETKVWITDYGYDETLHAFDKSAGKLGIDQIDLLILHQAFPGEFDRTIDAYKALERLLADGNVRAMLRWHLQQGRQVIPKSVTPSRIAENLDVFDFELTPDEIAAVDTLDMDVRGGPEPEQITREKFGIAIPEA